jgi:hypothetical protein
MNCVRNDTHPASFCQLIPDPKAAKLHLVRIVDQSGYFDPEDYSVAVNSHRLWAARHGAPHNDCCEVPGPWCTLVLFVVHEKV